MTVKNGQVADESTFNDGFMSRKADTSTIGKIDLNEASTTAITDVQAVINTNITNIDTNTTDIGTNATNIATNVTDIGTNVTNIGTNTTNIGTNTTNIGTNTTDIADINDAATGAPRMVGSLIQAANLPSYVEDVEEYADFASLPVTGETGKIYITLDDNKTFRWSGSVYVPLSGDGGGLAEWITLTPYSQIDKDVVWLAADNKIYRCIVTNTDAVFTPASWQELSPGEVAALGITYDNADSNLAATNVKAGLDELGDRTAVINSTATGNLEINDGNGTGIFREESDVYFKEDFIENAPSDVFETVNGTIGEIAFTLPVKSLSWISTALSGSMNHKSTHSYNITGGNNRIKGSLRKALMALEVEYFNAGDAGDYIITAQESADNITFTYLNDHVCKKSDGGPDTAKILFNVKEGSFYLRYQITNTIAVPSGVIRIDNTQFRKNPTPTAEFVESENVIYSGYTSRVGVDPYMILLPVATQNNSGSLIEVTNTDHTRFTAKAKCNAVIGVGGQRPDSDFNLYANVYDSSDNLIIRRGDFATTGNQAAASIDVQLNHGDYVIMTAGGDPLVNDIRTNFSVTATHSQSNVVWEGATDSENTENTFKGKIDAFSGTPVVNANSTQLDFITSITDHGAGDYTLNWESGRYTVPPIVEGTAVRDGTNDYLTLNPRDVTTTSARIQIRQAGSGADRDFIISFTNDGTDYVNKSDIIYAVPAANIEPTVTKVLSADVTATGVINDLTFTGLVIGREYEVNTLIDVRHANTTGNIKDFSFTVDNGATNLITFVRTEGNVFYSSGAVTPSKIFTATDTTVTFNLVFQSNVRIEADGTFVQLTERNRDGYPLVEVVSNITHSNAPVWSGERWIDGRKIMMRSYEAHGSFTSTVTFAPSGTFSGVDVIDVSTTVKLTSGTIFSDYKNDGNTAYSEVASNGSAYVYITGFTVADVYATFKYLEP